MQIEEVAKKTYRLEIPVPGVGLIFSTYLIDVDSGILIEPGPATAIPYIQEAMREVGMHQLSWIIPTHIHMDHGGGTGTLADLFPQAMVVAHPKSARHIIDPTRLVQSTRLTYGDDFETLYGPILPVTESQVKILNDREVISVVDREFQIIYTPGHAPHHIAILDCQTGGLFCGEALGMATDDPLPAAAAPNFDMEDCFQTMRKLKDLQPQILFYSHGGVGLDPDNRIARVIDNTRFYGDLVLESLKKGESPHGISQKVVELASPQFPVEWEEDMVRVWRTGIVEGYTIYFRNMGLA